MASSRFGCRDGFTLAGRMRDRRQQPRMRTVRLVQVAHDGETAYARCRDLSDEGMKLDLTAPVELNACVTVALSHSIMLCGTVIWTNGRECGVAFDCPIDSAALLAATEPAPRMPYMPPTIEMLGARQAEMPKRSPQRRAAPRPGVSFQPGLAVTVVVGPNQEERCVLRWAQGNIAALELGPGDAAEPSAEPRGLLPSPDAD
jgi:hypothetical protein